MDPQCWPPPRFLGFVDTGKTLKIIKGLIVVSQWYIIRYTKLYTIIDTMSLILL
jgi:hypothetical protein